MSGPLPRRNQRGVALMLVLWVVVVLSAVASGVVIGVRHQTLVATTERARTAGRYAAESGVEAVKAELRARFRKAKAPREQAGVFGVLEATVREWGERALGSARFQVAVVDLGARIDLNATPDELLLGLLGQAAGQDRAAALLDALDDWKDQDDEPRPSGAEAADYARAGSPFRPPNAPFLRLDELTRIPGFNDTVAERLAPYLTVWGDGSINVNTAPLQVLAAVPELGEAGARVILDARGRGEPLASGIAAQQLLRDNRIGGYVRSINLITSVSRVLVVSRGWAQGEPLTHEIQAVLEISNPAGVGGPTLTVVQWTERDL